jgi:hypothetical protein
MTMQPNRAVVGSLVFVLATLAAARGARACSCIESGPPCQSYFQVDAAFAGTVRAIAPAPDQDPPFRTRRIEFEQVTAYRGVQGQTLTVFTPESEASCGYILPRANAIWCTPIAPRTACA